MDFHAGQRWTYRSPEGFASSRLIIGAVVSFEGGESVICCSVTQAPRSGGGEHHDAVSIPFLPLTESAFRATVLEFDGSGDPLDTFAERLQDWSNDPKGLTIFTVPFDGQLDRLIARQMAEIVKRSAA